MVFTLKNKFNKDQTAYILQAAFEYLISLLVTGSFLATITKEMGVSDGVTGVLSSVVSLGCLFQLVSLFIKRKRDKGFVITMSIINQLLFMFLYVIPMLKISADLKTLLFVVSIVLAYFVYNVAHPKKISWLMSAVEREHRGIFTANKEIISLIAGMTFSYSAGAVSDYFVDRGQASVCFAIFIGLIVVLMSVHTVSLAVVSEQPKEQVSTTVNFWGTVKSIAKNKKIMKATLLFTLYFVAKDVALPFYGSYQINDLGFNLKFVTFMTILCSVSRILVSRFWGRYADRKGFAVMTEKCLIFLALSFVSAGFANKSTGAVAFSLYYIFFGIAMGGIGSAMLNMIFEYADSDKRSDSLAICQAVAGVVGFLSTIAVTPLMSNIQSNGNVFLGININAQQVLSFMAVIVVVVSIVFVRLSLIEKIEK